ncbi:hypothetical protein INR49_020530, partial [Caranx melampygus]
MKGAWHDTPWLLLCPKCPLCALGLVARPAAFFSTAEGMMLRSSIPGCSVAKPGSWQAALGLCHFSSPLAERNAPFVKCAEIEVGLCTGAALSAEISGMTTPGSSCAQKTAALSTAEGMMLRSAGRPGFQLICVGGQSWLLCGKPGSWQAALGLCHFSTPLAERNAPFVKCAENEAGLCTGAALSAEISGMTTPWLLLCPKCPLCALGLVAVTFALRWLRDPRLFFFTAEGMMLRSAGRRGSQLKCAALGLCHFSAPLAERNAPFVKCAENEAGLCTGAALSAEISGMANPLLLSTAEGMMLRTEMCLGRNAPFVKWAALSAEISGMTTPWLLLCPKCPLCAWGLVARPAAFLSTAEGMMLRSAGRPGSQLKCVWGQSWLWQAALGLNAPFVKWAALSAEINPLLLSTAEGMMLRSAGRPGSWQAALGLCHFSTPRGRLSAEISGMTTPGSSCAKVPLCALGLVAVTFALRWLRDPRLFFSTAEGMMLRSAGRPGSQLKCVWGSIPGCSVAKPGSWQAALGLCHFSSPLAERNAPFVKCAENEAGLCTGALLKCVWVNPGCSVAKPGSWQAAWACRNAPFVKCAENEAGLCTGAALSAEINPLLLSTAEGMMLRTEMCLGVNLGCFVAKPGSWQAALGLSEISGMTTPWLLLCPKCPFTRGFCSTAEGMMLRTEMCLGFNPGCSVAKPGSWQAALGLCHFSAPLAERNAPFVKCAENEAGLCTGAALSAEINPLLLSTAEGMMLRTDMCLGVNPGCCVAKPGSWQAALGLCHFPLLAERNAPFVKCAENEAGLCTGAALSAEISGMTTPGSSCAQSALFRPAAFFSTAEGMMLRTEMCLRSIPGCSVAKPGSWQAALGLCHFSMGLCTGAALSAEISGMTTPGSSCAQVPLCALGLAAVTFALRWRDPLLLSTAEGMMLRSAGRPAALGLCHFSTPLAERNAPFVKCAENEAGLCTGAHYPRLFFHCGGEGMMLRSSIPGCSVAKPGSWQAALGLNAPFVKCAENEAGLCTGAALSAEISGMPLKCVWGSILGCFVAKPGSWQAALGLCHFSTLGERNAPFVKCAEIEAGLCTGAALSAEISGMTTPWLSCAQSALLPRLFVPTAEGMMLRSAGRPGSQLKCVWGSILAAALGCKCAFVKCAENEAGLCTGAALSAEIKTRCFLICVWGSILGCCVAKPGSWQAALGLCHFSTSSERNAPFVKCAENEAGLCTGAALSAEISGMTTPWLLLCPKCPLCALGLVAVTFALRWLRDPRLFFSTAEGMMLRTEMCLRSIPGCSVAKPGSWQAALGLNAPFVKWAALSAEIMPLCALGLAAVTFALRWLRDPRLLSTAEGMMLRSAGRPGCMGLCHFSAPLAERNAPFVKWAALSAEISGMASSWLVLCLNLPISDMCLGVNPGCCVAKPGSWQAALGLNAPFVKCAENEAGLCTGAALSAEISGMTTPGSSCAQSALLPRLFSTAEGMMLRSAGRPGSQLKCVWGSIPGCCAALGLCHFSTPLAERNAPFVKCAENEAGLCTGAALSAEISGMTTPGSSCAQNPLLLSTAEGMMLRSAGRPAALGLCHFSTPLAERNAPFVKCAENEAGLCTGAALPLCALGLGCHFCAPLAERPAAFFFTAEGMMLRLMKCVWGSIPGCSVAKPGSWQAALGLCHFSAPLAERNAPFVKCAENEAGLCTGAALSAEINPRLLSTAEGMMLRSSIPGCSVAKPGSWQAALGLCHFSAPLAERNAPFVKCAENEAGLCTGAALSAEISGMASSWLVLCLNLPICSRGLAAVTFALRCLRDPLLWQAALGLNAPFVKCAENEAGLCTGAALSAEISGMTTPGSPRPAAFLFTAEGMMLRSAGRPGSQLKCVWGSIPGCSVAKPGSWQAALGLCHFSNEAGLCTGAALSAEINPLLSTAEGMMLRSAGRPGSWQAALGLCHFSTPRERNAPFVKCAENEAGLGMTTPWLLLCPKCPLCALGLVAVTFALRWLRDPRLFFSTAEGMMLRSAGRPGSQLKCAALGLCHFSSPLAERNAPFVKWAALSAEINPLLLSTAEGMMLRSAGRPVSQLICVWGSILGCCAALGLCHFSTPLAERNAPFVKCAENEAGLCTGAALSAEISGMTTPWLLLCPKCPLRPAAFFFTAEGMMLRSAGRPGSQLKCNEAGLCTGAALSAEI